MKSLIWKEWRENFRRCPLPCVLILGPMILTGVPTMMDEVYCFAVSLVAAISGALLGFLQFFPEASGDKRSLLLHLPLSRTRIFLAKAIAGVSLYALALAVPFACVLGLAIVPGYVAAPFRWPMALPWLADILTGLVYYFAGILVAQREASWYGSRLLPLAASLFASIVVWTAAEFYQALAAILFLGGCVAVAAWASLVGATARPWLTRVAGFSSAVTMVTALMVLVFVVKVPIGLSLETPFVYPYEFDRQGRVLMVRTEDEKADRRIQAITDLAGNVPEDFRGQRMDTYALNEIAAPGGIAFPLPKLQSYRSPGRFLLEYKNGSAPGHERWWYVPQEGRIAGYDKESKRPLGSVGPDGFVPPGDRPTSWFKGEPSSVAFFYKASARNPLAFPDGVFTVDFHKGIVRTLFVPSQGEHVEWASRRQDDKEKWAMYFVGSDRAVYAFELDGSMAFSAPLACSPGEYRVWSMGRLERPRRYWVWYVARWHLPLETMETMPELQVVIYDAKGQEIAPRQIAQARPGTARDAPIGNVVVESSPLHALSGLVTPPAEAAFLTGAMRLLESQSRAEDGARIALPLQFLYYTTQAFLPGVRWDARQHPGLVAWFYCLMFGAALACGVACFAWPRRYAASLRLRAAWGLIGLIFGWAGLVLMLVMSEWPARIACVRCGKSRVVTRERCEHCGAAQGTPAPDGTEIFEQTADEPLPHLANR